MAWTGKEENQRAIEALKRRMIDAAADVVQKGSLLLQTQQRLNASHRPGPEVRTGNLWRNIVVRPIRKVGEYVWQGGTQSGAKYSRAQELGAVIYPKRGMFLVWTDGPRPISKEEWQQAQREGRVHRARMVTLPARPFMRPGVEQTAPRYQDLAQRAFASAIRG